MAMATSNKKKVVALMLMHDFLEDDEEEKPKRRTRDWIRRRGERGFYATLVSELSVEDTSSFREMFRMTVSDFRTILGKIEKDITPMARTGGTAIINLETRLALTLRFLATGETFRSLSFTFRISRAAVSYIVIEVCKAIISNMQSDYMKLPTTCNEWLEIAKECEQKWQYPNCIGAVDGKHIILQAPSNAGSLYYNYKHSNSIVLMAVAGPNYECIYADIGTNGRVSDGGVWNKCGFQQALNNNKLSLPEPRPLPGWDPSKPIPYVLVGDDAFALKPNMMKPYAQTGLTDERRIYNYRHSRARRISENLFGILVSRWRVFRNAILLSPVNVEPVLMATLILHNFLRRSTESSRIYCPSGLVDSSDGTQGIGNGTWRQSEGSTGLIPVQVTPSGHNPSVKAKEIRDTLKDYFCDEGQVSWQWGRS